MRARAVEVKKLANRKRIMSMHLIHAKLPECRVEQLLGILVGSEECDFEIIAELLFINPSLLKGTLQHMNQKFILWGQGLFTRQLFRPILYHVEQEILKLLHNVVRSRAGSKNHWKLIESREVEEEGFEYRLLDNGL